jgi:hypothetical protein
VSDQMHKPIPVSAAEHIAKEFGWDQVVIIARKVGAGAAGGEHCTTYGVTYEHCGTAARIGNFLKHKIMQWPGATSFQRRIAKWMLECFGELIAADTAERNHRFLEEALELVQARGCTEDEANKLVSYVFGRPIGEPPQEVGGVMVTLAALCNAANIDMELAAEAELTRISAPPMIERIRAKQLTKPALSPLPGIYPLRKPLPSKQQETKKGKYTDEQLNSWWAARCVKCGWCGLSKYCDGGMQIADTGDYSDITCPRCGGAIEDDDEEK